jgi:hypothetical protein
LIIDPTPFERASELRFPPTFRAPDIEPYRRPSRPAPMRDGLFRNVMSAAVPQASTSSSCAAHFSRYHDLQHPQHTASPASATRRVSRVSRASRLPRPPSAASAARRVSRRARAADAARGGHWRRRRGRGTPPSASSSPFAGRRARGAAHWGATSSAGCWHCAPTDF